ncbi:MAG: TlyA family RNA methyltransferase [bacterium]
MSSIKQRLDLILQTRFPQFSRQQIQGLIMQGKVLVEGEVVTKSGFSIKEESVIELLQDELPFVSRGGLKLEKAFTLGWLDAAGKICADVGASTGGFTDCLLQHGAKTIYAIDVGYGQLDQKLRNNPDVVVMEKTNARNVVELLEKIDIVTIDASFISLRLLFPVLRNWLQPDGVVVALFKPQFEAGKELAAKNKGVIKKETDRLRLLDEFKHWLGENNFTLVNEAESPIRGPKGNVEYLLLVQCGEQ